MPLNKPSGNFYMWAWSWNPLAGRCLHGCKYCYVTKKICKMLLRIGNKKYIGEPRLEEKELRTRLVKPNDGKLIFVEACGDLFQKAVSDDIILAVLEYCNAFPDNEYLFQSKNPGRFFEFLDDFPPNFILGTTIETNRHISLTIDPLPEWCQPPPSRYQRMLSIAQLRIEGYETMISIEPIVDFDLEPFIAMINTANPRFVSIGADSQNCNLPEPNHRKLYVFIKELEKITNVRLKKNLKRIID